MGIYVRRISEETKRMSDALTATEMVLAREQQLSALDGLAAAAAHELGTPLATIALVAKELKRELPDADRHMEDLDLLASQAARCREILSTLTTRDDEGDHVFARMKLSVMVGEIVEPLRDGDIEITMSAQSEENEDHPARAEPVITRNSGLLYGLANLIDNAVDFAGTRVDIAMRWDRDQIAILIEDDGQGFAQDIIDRLGEPYVTTRKWRWSEAPPADGSHDGMGLGFFIAETLLERTGAWVAVANRPQPEHGAIVRIVWPRNKIDVEWRYLTRYMGLKFTSNHTCRPAGLQIASNAKSGLYLGLNGMRSANSPGGSKYD